MNVLIRKKEKGAIILMFLVFLPFILAFVGLAVDFGYVYATKTKMQNMVDAAALAGVNHLKDDKRPLVGDYVRAFLVANDFEAKGDGDTDVLTKDENWNMTFEKTVVDKDGAKTITEVDTAADADRLRVTIVQDIKLVFLPILSMDLANMELKATAVAQGGSKPIESKRKFQFITYQKLILGSKTGSNGSVFIPSYTKLSNTNTQGPDDRGEFLILDIYAKQYEFKKESQLRTAGRIFSEQAGATQGQVILKEDVKGAGIMFANSGSKVLQASDQLSFREYGNNETIQKYVDQLWGDAIKIAADAKSTNAIIFEIDTDASYNDYAIKNAIKDGFVDKNDKMDIVVPVIIINTSKTGAKVKASFNVSFYSFTKPIIADGVDLEMTGSMYPSSSESQGYGKSNRDRTTFYGIYCLAGTFTTLRSCVDKDFSGIIYADNGITINSTYSNKRHVFRDTLVSRWDIEIGNDSGGEIAHRFESAPLSEGKLSLVE